LTLTKSDADAVLAPLINQMESQTRQLRGIFAAVVLILLASVAYVGFYVYRWQPPPPAQIVVAQPPQLGNYNGDYLIREVNFSVNITEGTGTINWTMEYPAQTPYYSLRFDDDNGLVFGTSITANGSQNLSSVVTGASIWVSGQMVRL